MPLSSPRGFLDLSAAEVEKAWKATAGSRFRFLGSSLVREEIPLASKLAVFEAFGHRVKDLNHKRKKEMLLLV